MKLIKKLLPLTTVSGVATIVTPIVTSCGGIKYTEFAIPTLEEMESYPFVKTKGGKINTNEATKIYFEDVKKNKQIFVDDYIKCSLLAQSNSTTSYEWLGIGPIDSNDGRISTRDRWEITGEDDEGEKVDASYIYEMINIKWVVNYVLGNDLSSNWIITPVYKTVAELKEDTKWSYKYTAKVYDPSTKKYKKETRKLNYKSKDADLEEVAEVLQYYSEDMPSYYLSETGIQE